MGACIFFINSRLKEARDSGLSARLFPYGVAMKDVPEKLREILKEHADLASHDDTIIKSDAHGQLGASMVVWDDSEDGYHLDFSGL